MQIFHGALTAPALQYQRKENPFEKEAIHMMVQETNTRSTQLQELCAAVRKYATARDYQHLP